jgi:hypothetical protein
MERETTIGRTNVRAGEKIQEKVVKDTMNMKDK